MDISTESKPEKSPEEMKCKKGCSCCCTTIQSNTNLNTCICGIQCKCIFKNQSINCCCIIQDGQCICVPIHKFYQTQFMNNCGCNNFQKISCNCQLLLKSNLNQCNCMKNSYTPKYNCVCNLPTTFNQTNCNCINCCFTNLLIKQTNCRCNTKQQKGNCCCGKDCKCCASKENEDDEDEKTNEESS